MVPWPNLIYGVGDYNPLLDNLGQMPDRPITHLDTVIEFLASLFLA